MNSAMLTQPCSLQKGVGVFAVSKANIFSIALAMVWIFNVASCEKGKTWL